jgi:hypothetical protein
MTDCPSPENEIAGLRQMLGDQLGPWAKPMASR